MRIAFDCSTIMSLPACALAFVSICFKFVDGGASGFDYNTPEHKLRENYDFIIVGGGPAGCRMLEKLTNVSDVQQIFNVLLIEAGGNPPLWTDIPISMHYVRKPGFENITWKYNTPKYGVYENDMPITGRVLGGGTSINGNFYQRGCATDFNEIKEKTQCDGWNFDEALRIFKHDENNHDPEVNENGKHGTDGSLCVNVLPLNEERLESYDIWREALAQNGFKHQDLLDGTCHGIENRVQTTVCNSVRQSAVTAFITPFFLARKEHMHIKLNTLVTKLIFEEQLNEETEKTEPKVIGVETVDLLTNGTVKKFFAKEVIVTAGSLRTSHLLMLSGIGPTGHLEENGIDTIVDLPGVGQNLRYHSQASAFTMNVTPSWLPSIYCDSYESYLLNSTGSLASLKSVFGGIAYHRLNRNENKPEDETDKLQPSDVEYLSAGIIEEGSTENIISATVVLMHPKSKGSVSLNSSSAFESPYVFMNFFDDQTDLDKLAGGAVDLLKIMKSSPFTSVGAEVNETPIPECKEHSFGTFEYFRCVYNNTVRNNNHFVGTSKMGILNNDPMAVVDCRCRVHGVRSLRVADMSIFESIPQGHVATISYLTGYRCAEFIIADHA